MKAHRMIGLVVFLLICAMVGTSCHKKENDKDNTRISESQSQEEQNKTTKKDKSSPDATSNKKGDDSAGEASASDPETYEMIISPDGNVVHADGAEKDNAGSTAGNGTGGSSAGTSASDSKPAQVNPGSSPSDSQTAQEKPESPGQDTRPGQTEPEAPAPSVPEEPSNGETIELPLVPAN